ncbi:MAG: hypothetical protein COA91_11815 [Robiginitomaculum sp.]|nr:MAG: hypothetical protein COA91_11815 [Robiginitomaculum sp.]
MLALLNVLLFLFRLPTYLLFPVLWLIRKAGGPRDIFKNLVNNMLTNCIMFTLTLGGGFFVAEPLLETLGDLRAGQVEIQEIVEDTNDVTKENNALLKQLLASQTDIDPETKKSIEETLKSLLGATKGERKQAGDKLRAADVDGAIKHLRSLADKQEGAIKDAARTYLDIGNIAFLNNTQEALAAYIRVTQLTPDDPQGWNQAGHLQQRLGDLVHAEIAYKNVLRLGLQRNDKMLQAIAYGNLGNIEQTRGNLDGAVDYHQKSLKLNKELGRKQGMASNYGNLGIVEALRENMSGACAYWRQAYGLFADIGAVPQMTQVSGWMQGAGCKDAPE